MKETPPTPPPKTRPSLRFDWEEWLPYLANSDLDDKHKRDMIITLNAIVEAFIDMRWHISAEQNTSGPSLDLRAVLEAAVVHSNNTQNQKEEV